MPVISGRQVGQADPEQTVADERHSGPGLQVARSQMDMAAEIVGRRRGCMSWAEQTRGRRAMTLTGPSIPTRILAAWQKAWSSFSGPSWRWLSRAWVAYRAPQI